MRDLFALEPEPGVTSAKPAESLGAWGTWSETPGVQVQHRLNGSCEARISADFCAPRHPSAIVLPGVFDQVRSTRAGRR